MQEDEVIRTDEDGGEREVVAPEEPQDSEAQRKNDNSAARAARKSFEKKLIQERERADAVAQRLGYEDFEQMENGSMASEYLEQEKSLIRGYTPERVEEILADESFLRFARWRLGRDNLEDVIDDYVGTVGNIEERVNGYAKMQRSTSSGKTAAQPAGLSRERREMLREWCRRYPNLAMTPTEFLDKKS